MARKRLGEILIERRVIQRDQLEQALAYQRQHGQRLGASLVALGFITEVQLCEVLAHELGLKAITTISSQVADWGALRALQARFCEIHDLFPISVGVAAGRKTMVVAMADPLNLPVIEEMRFSTSMGVQPVIAPLSEIRSAIRRFYYRQNDGGASSSSSVSSDRMVIIRPDGKEQEISSTSSAPVARARHTVAVSAENNGPSQAQAATGAREGLDQKFSALLRVLEKKGLITHQEFLNELMNKGR